ncbi:MAG TPA: hypothetical protein VHF06_32630 [Pseudonocardiaceae bacterium]|nr:hypothetical protein [Pseudonocardiaceae bacterium]
MRTVVARVGASMAAIGLVVLVAGTFLPWLRSGSVLRDSYQSAGALRDLVGGTPAVVLGAWLFVIPACGLCVALYALRLRRVSAGLSCLVSAVVGTAAGLVVVQGTDPGSLIGPAATGPAVTLIGATVALAGAIAVLASPRGRQTTEGSP